MPFYAASRGQGPSSTSLRLPYLHATLGACFSSRVAVAVQNQRDYDVVEGLGVFWDVIFAPVANPNKLGVAALISVHRLLSKNSSDFFRSGHERDWSDVRYVYYTESDQIARYRSVEALLAVVDADPARNVVVPRRAVPLPVSSEFPSSEKLRGELRLNADLGERPLLSGRQACCFLGDPAAACKQIDLIQRDEFKRRNLTLLRRRRPKNSFAILPGEGNFLKMAFRPCVLRNRTTTTASCATSPPR
mmetsp:Transcript_32799/g.104592  ORF Transcript_32799/g.104592 Transcript_32799/m.104592 type:complete len:247 (+) Transcript_32799:649-1389(+)